MGSIVFIDGCKVWLVLRVTCCCHGKRGRTALEIKCNQVGLLIYRPAKVVYRRVSGEQIRPKPVTRAKDGTNRQVCWIPLCPKMILAKGARGAPKGCKGQGALDALLTPKGTSRVGSKNSSSRGGNLGLLASGQFFFSTAPRALKRFQQASRGLIHPNAD